jgi:DinB superfamily
MNSTTLAALANFPDLLVANFAAVPMGLVHWRPASWEGIPSERLTAIEQICHVRDIEIDGYHVRFRRTLTEERPVLPDIAGESLAEERQYSRAVAVDVLASFKAARAATLRTIAGLTEQQLNRVAIFESRPTTLRGLVYYLCSHDYQHLAGLQWLRGRAEEARRSG